jgi:hypothetical protein
MLSLAFMILGPLVFAGGLATVLWSTRPWEVRATLPGPALVPTRQTIKPTAPSTASDLVLIQRAAQLCRRLRQRGRHAEAGILVATARAGDLRGIIDLLHEHDVSTEK